MDTPLISVIVTVYNKSPYIGCTARSLLAQQSADLPMEFIFVDDHSHDGTLSRLSPLVDGAENITLLRNMSNAGPAVRLNQGARLARGAYIQGFDSDDIMPRGTSAAMLRLLKEHNADMAYGRWQRTAEDGEALLSRQMADQPKHWVSETPLKTILGGGFVRMAFMARADVFAKAAGADEDIFIQDESLPLRLAALANKLVVVEEPVLLVPKVEGVLSGNRSQLNHDRFMANYRFLLNPPRALSNEEQFGLYRRCVSAAWKQQRLTGGLLSHVSGRFFRYTTTRHGITTKVDKNYLNDLYHYFCRLTDVRAIIR